ncbi:MAG: DUF302 domain-containing protein [Rhodothermaceae bacterium]|nr:DUF302 domain-containing protein [Rhodothermaceae bacterium]
MPVWFRPTLLVLFVTLPLVSACAPTNEAEQSPASSQDAPRPTGLVTVASAHSADSTYQRLRDAIEANPNLTILFELDHQANALSADLTMRPARLVLFGNPQAGTVLMQEAPSIGLDLPLKMLVWEDSEGQAFVTYTDPLHLTWRHDLDDVQLLRERPDLRGIPLTMRDVLEQLATTATGE